MGNVLSKEAGNRERTGLPYLSREDIEVIEHLKSRLATMSIPKYGYKSWYTKAIGLYLDDDQVDRNNYVMGVNNEGGHIADWAFKNVQERDRKQARDAELYVLTKLEDPDGGIPGKDAFGTVYMVQNNGPCRSCRRIIRKFFLPYYQWINVIIWYGEHFKAKSGMLYGIENADPFLNGYVVRWRGSGTFDL